MFLQKLLLLALAATPITGFAQQQNQTIDTGGGLSEVVVTAQKREEKLLDVPMSITALTGDTLERQGATSILDIAATVPGFSTIEYAPGQNRAQIRGVSAATGNATIGLYLDEMPINVDSVQVGPDVRFIDLERIEVLRGPQGTLYGEGSMGGTLRYITRAPNLQDTSFGFDVALGNVKDGSQLSRGNVVINLPVIDDKFALRFAGGYEQSPGWVDYTPLNKKDVNKGKSTTGRLKALWKISDSFRATLILTHQNSDYDSQVFGDKNRLAPYVALQPSESKMSLANLVLEYQAATFSFLSSTGYMKRDFTAAYDLTGFFAPIYYAPPPFGFGLPPGSIQSVILPGTTDYKVLTQEFRFSSRSEGPISWTMGAYYRDYTEDSLGRSITTPNPIGLDLLFSEGQRKSKQTAAFGELGYDFSEQWSATFGLRYFQDKRTGSGRSANFGFPVPEPNNSATFSSTNPRLVVSYKPNNDVLLYASAAQGFRSGGFNLIGTRPPGCNFPSSFEPEDLKTYELGSNLSFAGGKAIIQAGIYRNDWKNIQTSIFCPGSQVTQTTNVGKASGNGVDFALTLKPTEALTMVLSGGYNDSQYDASSAAQFKGDRIDYAPEFSGAASVDYDFNWSAKLPGRLHLDYQHTGDFSIALRNFPGPGVAYSDAYGRLNARLSLISGEWELALFGQNITDTNKQVMPPIGVLLVPVSMQPATFGVNVRYNF